MNPYNHSAAALISNSTRKDIESGKREPKDLVEQVHKFSSCGGETIRKGAGKITETFNDALYSVEIEETKALRETLNKNFDKAQKHREKAREIEESIQEMVIPILEDNNFLVQKTLKEMNEALLPYAKAFEERKVSEQKQQELMNVFARKQLLIRAALITASELAAKDHDLSAFEHAIPVEGVPEHIRQEAKDRVLKYLKTAFQKSEGLTPEEQELCLKTVDQDFYNYDSKNSIAYELGATINNQKNNPLMYIPEKNMLENYGGITAPMEELLAEKLLQRTMEYQSIFSLASLGETPKLNIVKRIQNGAYRRNHSFEKKAQKNDEDIKVATGEKKPSGLDEEDERKKAKHANNLNSNEDDLKQLNERSLNKYADYDLKKMREQMLLSYGATANDETQKDEHGNVIKGDFSVTKKNTLKAANNALSVAFLLKSLNSKYTPKERKRQLNDCVSLNLHRGMSNDNVMTQRTVDQCFEKHIQNLKEDAKQLNQTFAQAVSNPATVLAGVHSLVVIGMIVANYKARAEEIKHRNARADILKELIDIDSIQNPLDRSIKTDNLVMKRLGVVEQILNEDVLDDYKKAHFYEDMNALAQRISGENISAVSFVESGRYEQRLKDSISEDLAIYLKKSDALSSTKAFIEEQRNVLTSASNINALIQDFEQNIVAQLNKEEFEEIKPYKAHLVTALQEALQEAKIQNNFDPKSVREYFEKRTEAIKINSDKGGEQEEDRIKALKEFSEKVANLIEQSDMSAFAQNQQVVFKQDPLFDSANRVIQALEAKRSIASMLDSKRGIEDVINFLYIAPSYAIKSEFADLIGDKAQALDLNASLRERLTLLSTHHYIALTIPEMKEMGWSKEQIEGYSKGGEKLEKAFNDFKDKSGRVIQKTADIREGIVTVAAIDQNLIATESLRRDIIKKGSGTQVLDSDFFKELSQVASLDLMLKHKQYSELARGEESLEATYRTIVEDIQNYSEWLRPRMSNEDKAEEIHNKNMGESKENEKEDKENNLSFVDKVVSKFKFKIK